MVLTAIFITLACLSCLLTLWQYFAASRFPLHQRTTDSKFQPAVTLLKPLKGSDVETRACLESWFRQDYSGPVQIVFGVASVEDSVCAVVRELMQSYPKIDAALVICNTLLGPNAKVSSLIQMERKAKHDIVIISDADVRVPADLLVNVVAPLQDQNVGLVNCFYRFANPSTVAMRWEAIAVNADFWSMVLQSKSLKPLDFALGAVMATPRAQLKAIGGFEALVDYLADDYQLGNRIAKNGKRIELCPVVAECWESPRGWSAIWHHQLRWARTIRICQPVPFFFSILNNATLWPLLLFVWLWLVHPTKDPKVIFVPLLVFLPVRIFTALKEEEKLTRGMDQYTYFWLIPVKDLINVAVWALAFIGNTVQWRGEKFKIVSGGKLQKQN